MNKIMNNLHVIIQIKYHLNLYLNEKETISNKPLFYN